MAIPKDSVPEGRVALCVRTTARELDSPAAELELSRAPDSSSVM